MLSGRYYPMGVFTPVYPTMINLALFVMGVGELGKGYAVLSLLASRAIQQLWKCCSAGWEFFNVDFGAIHARIIYGFR